MEHPWQENNERYLRSEGAEKILQKLPMIQIIRNKTEYGPIHKQGGYISYYEIC